MKKNNSKLAKRLSQYGSFALAAIGASEADGQVVYTDVNPDFSGGMGSSYAIDLNNDGVDDVIIDNNAYTTISSNTVARLYANPQGTNGLLGSGLNSGYAYPYALNSGDNISSGAGSFLNGIANSLNYANFYGNWIGVTDKYLGIQFDISGNTHYGWIRLDAAANGDFVVKDYAYESTPGAGILAGFTVTPTCLPPTGLGVSNIAPTTANVSWNPEPNATSGYVWFVFNAGDDPLASTPVDSGTTASGTTTATATGLLSGQAYDAYVKSDCGVTDGQSLLEGPITFNTNYACGDNFYDSGGPGLAYTDNESFTYIFTTSTPGNLVRLSFNLVDLETCCDVLMVYDGIGTGGTLLEADLESPKKFFASPGSGGLTVTFSSDVSITNAGWEATVACVDPEYIYEAGVWTPSDPNGVSISTDDVLVYSGTATFTADTQMDVLWINNGAVLNIEAVLSAGGAIDNNGELVFVSNGTALGQLNDMTGSVLIGFGDETVQRHIPARRAFRALSPAVTTTTTINDNWQEGVHNIGTNYPADNIDPNPGFGTHITGSTTGVNGFDATQAGASSLYLFDEAIQTWIPISDTNANPLNAGNAMLLFVQGDRSINLGTNSPPPTNTILRATGDLYVGDYFDTALSNATGGYSLVGNPYQAIVDMNDVLANSTNLNVAYYYVWDPNVGTNGAYALVDLTGGTTTPPASDANQFLQPGQGAFVSTLIPGAATFFVEEADKDVAQTPTNVFKPQAVASISLELYEAGNFANGGPVADGFLVKFNPGGNNGMDSKDAAKLMNFDENIAVVNGTNLFIMENRDMPKQNEVLPFHNGNYRSTDYVYQIQVNGLAGASPVLVDAYLGTQTPLQDGLNTVNFSVDQSIAASVAPDRFSIVFQKGLSTTDVLIEGLSLYPNPANGGSFFILAPGTAGQDLRVSIYDLLGRKVYGEVLKAEANNRIEVNVQSLRAGAYMVKLETGGKSFVQKLIVE